MKKVHERFENLNWDVQIERMYKQNTQTIYYKNVIPVSIMLESAHSYLLSFGLGNRIAKFMTPNAMDLVIQSFDFSTCFVRASSMQSKSYKHVKSC